MGIRFRCHHCEHELHVKDFQAGKRGRCPQCKERLRIPEGDAEYSLPVDNKRSLHRGRASPQDSREHQRQPGGGREQLSSLASDQTTSATAPSVAPAPAISSAAPTAASNAESTAAEAHAEQESATFASDSNAGPCDTHQALDGGQLPEAIVAAPQAKWYVRPAQGGQYGPAPGEVMHQWLQENRVPADAFVWCEGWPDWLLAAEVFPEVFAQPPAPTVSAEVPFGTPQGWVERVAQAPAGESPPVGAVVMPQDARQRRRYRRRRNYAVMISLLSVTMVVLVLALVIVLLRQSQE